MNLLLFPAQRLDANNRLLVSGNQHLHLQNIVKVTPGDSIRVGEINGKMGAATVISCSPEHTLLNVELSVEPPPPIDLKLILALPRPKMMRRVLQAVASLGVKEIHLINSYRVEKSFWQTPWLEPEAIRTQLLLGLEQCCDTLMPRVFLQKRFKPFVEDKLPEIIKGTHALVAHPYTQAPCPWNLRESVTLAIGPEGGFIPYEIEKLVDCGFTPVTLGQRILRVETAIPVLVARLFG
ncbi:MAG: 16S rRNA (uracil(1498)-N(3))-methyltransferase [Porticoccaceae bacterium]